MLTRQAALQVAEHGVRVNALAPGTPEDVAEAALWLLGDGSSWITGPTLDVNGGRVMP